MSLKLWAEDLKKKKKKKKKILWLVLPYWLYEKALTELKNEIE